MLLTQKQSLKPNGSELIQRPQKQSCYNKLFQMYVCILLEARKALTLSRGVGGKAACPPASAQGQEPIMV